MKEPDISNSKRKAILLTLPVSIFYWEVSIAEIIPISLREANRFIESTTATAGAHRAVNFVWRSPMSQGYFMALLSWGGRSPGIWMMDGPPR